MRHLPSFLFFASAVAFGAGALGAAPAGAQVQDRMIIIYGNDVCPSSQGEAIVVCARKPEAERYRIPKELRQEDAAPTDTAWANRVQDVEYAGKGGVQTCSASGGDGWAGCMKKIFANARADQAQQNATQQAATK